MIIEKHKSRIVLLSILTFSFLFVIGAVKASSLNAGELSSEGSFLIGEEAETKLLEIGYTQNEIDQMRDRAQLNIIAEVIEKEGKEGILWLLKIGVSPEQIDRAKNHGAQQNLNEGINRDPKMGGVYDMEYMVCQGNIGGAAVFETVWGPVTGSFSTTAGWIGSHADNCPDAFCLIYHDVTYSTWYTYHLTTGTWTEHTGAWCRN